MEHLTWLPCCIPRPGCTRQETRTTSATKPSFSRSRIHACALAHSSAWGTLLDLLTVLTGLAVTVTCV